MRTLTRAALCAAASLTIAAPLTAAQAASATPAEGGTAPMCYPMPTNNICTWQGTTALETKTSGDFTQIEAVASPRTGYYYMKIVGKADCITWNGSAVYFYQLACDNHTYQEFYFVSGPTNYYDVGLLYLGSNSCMSGEGNGEDVVMAACNDTGAPNQLWYWPEEG